MVGIIRLTSIKYTIYLPLFTLVQVRSGNTNVIVELDIVFSTNLLFPSLKKILTKIKYV